jgi:hypothetical protein
MLTKREPHFYYRLASPLICRMLEGIMAVAADGFPLPATVALRRRAATRVLGIQNFGQSIPATYPRSRMS